jgi:hypothetical protein
MYGNLIYVCIDFTRHRDYRDYVHISYRTVVVTSLCAELGSEGEGAARRWLIFNLDLISALNGC